MPTFRDRVCITCGDVEYKTATLADVCRKCFEVAKSAPLILEEEQHLKSLGYLNVQLLGKNKHNKREWQFMHECGTLQVWVYGNIRKQLQLDPNTVPCSACGGKRRIEKAMAAYIAKHGITKQQLAEFERYSKKVRGLTAKTYKLYEQEINPLGLKRGQGPNDYHLDHIFPIIEGFKQGLEPSFIARKENLQMLKSIDNLSKGKK